MPKVRKWKCGSIEAHIQMHIQCGMVLTEQQIANNIRFHHIRNRKPLRGSVERQGDNKVLRSIRTFTAELKDLLISVWATENAVKYWPQMYFFRLKL